MTYTFIVKHKNMRRGIVVMGEEKAKHLKAYRSRVVLRRLH